MNFREQRKNGSGQRTEPSAPTQTFDARIGEEEQNRKQKEGQKEAVLEHLVSSYDPHESYGESILIYPQEDIYIIITIY